MNQVASAGEEARQAGANVSYCSFTKQHQEVHDEQETPFILAAIFLFGLLPFNRSAAVNLSAVSPQAITYAQLDLSTPTPAITNAGAVFVGVTTKILPAVGYHHPRRILPFPIRPLGLTDNALKVSAGDDHGCVINSLGDMVLGVVPRRQLGMDWTIMTDCPSVVNFANPSLISAGGNTTCGVTTAGQAYCWGLGGYGQMGNGTDTNENYSPVTVTIGTVSEDLVVGPARFAPSPQTGQLSAGALTRGGQLGMGRHAS